MIITKRLFYHLGLNLAWMQANVAQQFLFVGICGCDRSTQGQGGIIVNTLPRARCNFCGQNIQMTALHAYDADKHEWVELYQTEEGQLATRELTLTPGDQGPSTESPPAIHSS